MASNHHGSQGSGYGQDQWMGMGNYPASSQSGTTPTPGFHAYDYPPPAMPMEPSYNIPRATPYSTGSQSHPLPPPPLIMPHTALWPSMFTSQPGQPSYQPPILPAAPIQTPISASSMHTPADITPTSAKSTTSRRKLTDDERRQMCLEAEQNPNMKQTQIGAKFNVERSTVSKILRQKDKYMNPPHKEESTSPIKKSKVKLPDVERALVNWVRNEQKKGTPITDDKLRKQARFFSTTSPTSESQQQISSDAWLLRFKQKNMITTGSRRGKPSVSTDDVVIVDSSTTSLVDTPIEQSPLSSVGLASPPISPDEIGSHGHHSGDDDFFNYGGRDRFQDATSLEQVLSSDLEPGSAVLSPASPGILGEGTAGLDEPTTYLSNFSRQRSQTFPASDNETTPVSHPSSYSGRAGAPVPIRSLTAQVIERATAIDPRRTVKRHKSVPDIHDSETVFSSTMQPPPLPHSQEQSPNPGANSPTPEEARQALHLLKTFFQSQNSDAFDGDDYIMIGKLMEKLKILKRPTEIVHELSGGVHPVDVLDGTRTNKKRTILGIST